MKSGTAFVVGALLLLLVAASFVSGCNTWHGAGQDVEQVGDKMQGK